MHNQMPEPAGAGAMIFAPSLERLARADASDFNELNAIRDEWAQIFAEDFSHFDGFYALIIAAGHSLVDELPDLGRPQAITRETADKFLVAASGTDYLHSIGSIPAIQLRLAQHNESIVALIRQMTARAQQRPELARPIDALISLYFHHGFPAGAHSADVVRVIPDALLSFPEHSFSFALYLLAQSADAAEEIGRIVTFHVVERSDVTHDICQEIAAGAMGLESGPGSRLYELGSAILGPVARAVRDGRPDILDIFVSTFVLTPLGCNPRSQGAEVAHLEAQLSTLHAQLERFEEHLKAPLPVTAQDTSLVLEISRAKEELDRANNDFDAWMDERWNLAVRQLATQPTKTATLEAIQSGLAPLTSAELEQLRSDTAGAAQG